MFAEWKHDLERRLNAGCLNGKDVFWRSIRDEGVVRAVEDWLDTRCKGDWDIRLGDLDEARGRKILQIFFELEADKNAFKSAFTKA